MKYLPLFLFLSGCGTFTANVKEAAKACADQAAKDAAAEALPALAQAMACKDRNCVKDLVEALAKEQGRGAAECLLAQAHDRIVEASNE